MTALVCSPNCIAPLWTRSTCWGGRDTPAAASAGWPASEIRARIRAPLREIASKIVLVTLLGCCLFRSACACQAARPAPFTRILNEMCAPATRPLLRRGVLRREAGILDLDLSGEERKLRARRPDGARWLLSSFASSRLVENRCLFCCDFRSLLGCKSELFTLTH
jgi:hypothetical protein